jgi:hypothetical protein
MGIPTSFKVRHDKPNKNKTKWKTQFHGKRGSQTKNSGYQRLILETRWEINDTIHAGWHDPRLVKRKEN